jgi:hypothetical protein
MHQLNDTPATRLRDRLDPARLAREWLTLTGGDAAGARPLAEALHEYAREFSGFEGPLR